MSREWCTSPLHGNDDGHGSDCQAEELRINSAGIFRAFFP